MATRTVLPAYLLFVTGVLVTVAFLVRSHSFAQNPQLLSWAASIDVAILIPVVYLWLARRHRWPILTVVPVFVIAVTVGGVLLPARHQGLLGILDYLVVALELFLVGFVVNRVRLVRRDVRRAGATAEDFTETLELVLRRWISAPRVLQIAVSELSMLAYAMAWWSRTPMDPSRYTYHRRSGYTGAVTAFVFLIVVESAALHWFLLPRVPTLAWILLALSIYGILFLVGDLRAAQNRPVRIGTRELALRVGLRWRTEIPLARITSVEVTSTTDDTTLPLTLLGAHNVVVRFDSPQPLRGMYGTTKNVESVALFLDDPQGFARMLQSSAAEGDQADESRRR